MNTFAFVIPYYRNPKMLEVQVDNWNSYPAWLRQLVRVVLIDDCSPEPAEPILRRCELKKSLFRIRQDIPWNQHGARNLGAKVFGKDGEWGLFTDMDITLSPAQAERMIAKTWDPGRHYTFHREFLRGGPPKYHCNTFLVTRGAYWRAGGYDEDFCGAYGGDGIFLRALEQAAPSEHWADVTVHGHNDMVEDCSTRDWGRQGTKWHEDYLRRRSLKKDIPNGFKPQNPIRFTWERVL